MVYARSVALCRYLILVLKRRSVDFEHVHAFVISGKDGYAVCVREEVLVNISFVCPCTEDGCKFLFLNMGPLEPNGSRRGDKITQSPSRGVDNRRIQDFRHTRQRHGIASLV